MWCRVVMVVAGLAVAGCGGAAGPETRTTPEQASTPFADPCAQSIPKTEVDAPKGLIVPEGEIKVGKVTRVPPQLRVEGYIESQPSEVRQFFLESDDIKVTFSEDEGFEAEALISDGRHRNYWKVSKACDRGSAFAAIVVREEKAFEVDG